MSTYRAVVSVAVAGKPVNAGDTFEADDEQVAHAVAVGLVEAVESAGLGTDSVPASSHEETPKRATTHRTTRKAS
jgi:hypothetical protein